MPVLIVEYCGMAETVGIIATLFVVLYFSRKQMQSLSVDVETKVISDLDEKIHGITQNYSRTTRANKDGQ